MTDSRAQGDRDARTVLRADCALCSGLCCMVPAFGAGADFPIDKPAGTPCRNLVGHRCGIHARLRTEGFVGCVTFDCFGAGQHVTQMTVGGRDWRQDAATATQVRKAFPVARRLHEVLWYLAEARILAGAGAGAGATAHRVAEAVQATKLLLGLGPDDLAGVDVDAHLSWVNPVLVSVSEQAREGHGPGAGLRGADHRGADLIGADLRRLDLRAASLRGALLVGADLRDVNLSWADVTGADLRGADLRGADLSAALFVTAPQISSARGGDTTRIPAVLDRPAHWFQAP